MFTFTVPGEAQPSRRPRFARMGKGVRTYKDPRDAAYQDRVALFFEQAIGRADYGFPLRGPVLLTADFYRAPPKSMSRHRLAEALDGEHLPSTRPDLSNLVKAIEDALNGAAFGDDGQVASIRATKLYGTPRTVIGLEAMEAP